MHNKKWGAAIVALATGAFVFGAGTTAHAANGSACRQQDKSFSIPGKPDISVTINLCVERNNGRHRAVADVSWGSWAGVPKNAFDNFNVKIRLERYDRDQKTRSVNLTPYINAPDRYAHHITIETAWSTSSADGGWTSDGAVSYNINNDGKGDATWSLHGSPEIR